MELEKTLFRVYDRLLNDIYSKKIAFFAMNLGLFLFVISFLLFITANLTFEGKSNCKLEYNFSHRYNLIVSDGVNNLTMIISN